MGVCEVGGGSAESEHVVQQYNHVNDSDSHGTHKQDAHTGC